MQDLFRYKGCIDLNGPNVVLAQAFTDGYIADNTAWRFMKKSRELSSHTCDQETADEITKSIITVSFIERS